MRHTLCEPAAALTRLPLQLRDCENGSALPHATTGDSSCLYLCRCRQLSRIICPALLLLQLHDSKQGSEWDQTQHQEIHHERDVCTCAAVGRSAASSAQHCCASATYAAGAPGGNTGRSLRSHTPTTRSPSSRPLKGRSPVSSSQTAQQTAAQQQCVQMHCALTRNAYEVQWLVSTAYTAVGPHPMKETLWGFFVWGKVGVREPG
jgi:hypothetical protein